MHWKAWKTAPATGAPVTAFVTVPVKVYDETVGVGVAGLVLVADTTGVFVGGWKVGVTGVLVGVLVRVAVGVFVGGVTVPPVGS